MRCLQKLNQTKKEKKKLSGYKVTMFIYYLLGKGGYVFGSVGLSVCLFVCLSVNNITQKVMNGLG